MSSSSYLFTAIQRGNLQTVRELVEGNEDVNVHTSNADIYGGWTPLHHACSYGKLEIVKFLIQKKASVVAGDKSGQTPLYSACHEGERRPESVTKIAELLLTNGADANVAVLLNNGANINAQDGKGRTPLFDACRSQQPIDVDVIKLLLANNADRYMKWNDGLGPTDELRKYKHEEVLPLFESFDKWPLAVSGVLETPKQAAVMLNPRLSQHQHAIGTKALLLVRKLPVHEVAYEVLGFLSPAAVEKIFLG